MRFWIARIDRRVNKYLPERSAALQKDDTVVMLMMEFTAVAHDVVLQPQIGGRERFGPLVLTEGDTMMMGLIDCGRPERWRDTVLMERSKELCGSLRGLNLANVDVGSRRLMSDLGEFETSGRGDRRMKEK